MNSSPYIVTKLCASNEVFVKTDKIITENCIYNWSQVTKLAKSNQIIYPSTEQDVQNLVKDCSSKIRVIGSGLSYEGLASIISEDENAMLMSLERLTGFVKETQDTVTFKAGTTLDAIYQYLIDRNRMLPCSPGVIGIQTIAGAICTGTHGQGLYQSTLSDVISDLRLVLANGDIMEITEHDDDFGAAILSLGCLGVITEVTLKFIDNTIFICKKITTTFEDMKNLFYKCNETSEYAKMWWFPWTDDVHIWEVDPASLDCLEAYENNDRQLFSVSNAEDTSMNATIDQVVVKMGNDTKDENFMGKQFETVKRFKNVTNVTGNIYQILCKGIPVPQINCEIAIPYEKTVEALETLHRWHNASQKTLHYPFILRCIGESHAFLSPAYKKKVCYIGFLVYLAKDGSFMEGSMELLQELQVLLGKFGGVPHFGKHFINEIFDFEKILPKWENFKSIKLKLDPSGKFENKFIKRLFQSSQYTTYSYTSL
jgi:UDP-N-acetylenolpyruvoylglucosamine reductase